MMKQLAVLLCAALFWAAFPAAPAAADIPVTTVTWSTTTAQASPILALAGQTACSINIPTTGSPTGFTVVGQVSSDPLVYTSPSTAVWVTAPSPLNSISSTGSNNVANIASTGLLAFRINVTGISGGTLNVNLVCSPAAAAGSVSASVTFPYGFTADAQTATTASSVGLMAFNGSTVDRLRDDANKYLYVDCATGCSGSSLTLPYSYTSGQTATTASFIGIAAYNGTTVDALRSVTFGSAPGANTGSATVSANICSTSACASVQNSGLEVNPSNSTAAFSGQPLHPANTSGGGCSGITANTGTSPTQITKSFLATTMTASTAAQVVALSASTIVHICRIVISGNWSGAAAITIESGTGTTCASNTTTLANYEVPASGQTIIEGNGDMSVLEGASGYAICVSPGAFTLTSGLAYLDITYAQY